MRPARVSTICPNCDHSFEARGICHRHMPLSKAERPKKSANRGVFKKADLEWSQRVRERDGYRCRRCGKTKEEAQLHAAHIVSRRYKATRYLLEAGLTLCAGCHIFWGHRQPLEFAYWVRQEIGDEAYESLWKRAQTTTKRVKRKDVA